MTSLAAARSKFPLEFQMARREEVTVMGTWEESEPWLLS